jgi:hypothetical protein
VTVGIRLARLIALGYKVEVAFWGQAARELRETAVNFISLDGKHADFTKPAQQAASSRIRRAGAALLVARARLRWQCHGAVRL